MKWNSHSVVLVVLLVVGFALSACAPLGAGGAMEATTTGPGASAAEEVMPEGTGATATVTARSLRVRSAPDPEAAVVFGVKAGETYDVLGLSDDGEWVHLAIPAAPDGDGWVSSNFVSVSGPLVGGEMAGEAVLVPTPEPAEETATEGAVVEETAMPAPGFVRIQTDGTRLRVRAEPNVDASITGYVYDGEVYELVEVSADGQWVKIGGATEQPTDNPDGGWVTSQYVVIGQ